MPSQNPDPRQTLDPRKNAKALLGKHLRRLRLTAGLTTQAAAAARVDGYGVDSLQKAETGGQLPTDDLYAKLLDLYAATDLDRVYLGDLLEQARQDKQSAVPEFAEPWLEAEKAADSLRLWAPFMAPGLFQVKEYIRPQFDRTGRTADWAQENIDARLERQAILGGPDPVHVTAILHESVLYQLVGTPEVMVKQITHLLELSQRHNVVLQVVRDTGYFPGLEYWFEIASGPGMPDTLVMMALEDHTTDNRAVIRNATAWFQEIHGRAAPAAESRTVLTEAKSQWESQQ
jgi:Domain of unknown function (DUF5753)/Helix-turn-helix domain